MEQEGVTFQVRGDIIQVLPDSDEGCAYEMTGFLYVNVNIFVIHSKITMACDAVPYYTVTALVPTLK